MTAYRHWLDNEWIKHYDLVTGSPAQVDLVIRRWLAVALLLDESLAISDTQQIASYPLLEAFSDPDFCRHVDARPDWLELVASSGTTEPSNAARARQGLHRIATITEDWPTARKDKPKPVKLLVDAILAGKCSEPLEAIDRLERREFGHSQQDLGSCRSHLIGMIRSVHHFSGQRAASREATGPNLSYHGVLTEALTRHLAVDEKSDQNADLLQRAIERIDQLSETNEKIRFRRSSLQAALPITDPAYPLVWPTVLHGWNTAVQRHMDVDGGILTGYGGVPVGVRPETVDDIYAIETDAPELAKHASRLRGDPGRKSWGAIIAVANACKDERDDWKRAQTVNDFRGARHYLDILLEKCAVELLDRNDDVQKAPAYEASVIITDLGSGIAKAFSYADKIFTAAEAAALLVAECQKRRVFNVLKESADTLGA